MKDYVIDSFIFKNNNTLTDIYKYTKFRYNNSLEINDIKREITKLIKNNIIFFHNNNYKLSKEGNVILNDHKYYYSKIIIIIHDKARCPGHSNMQHTHHICYLCIILGHYSRAL